MVARLVVRQVLHPRAITLHPDGANFADLVERLVLKSKAAGRRRVLVLLQPAGPTMKRALKKKKKVS